MSVAILFFGFATILSAYQEKKSINLLKKELSNLKNIQEKGNKYSSQTEYRTRDYFETRTNLQKIASSIDNLSSKLSKLEDSARDRIEALNSASEEKEIGNIYSPKSIKASTPKKVSSLAAGRIAASVDADQRLSQVLGRLIYSNDSREINSSLPNVAVLGYSDLQEVLSPISNPFNLLPSYSKIPPHSAYIIVDLKQTRIGPWANLLESTKSSLYCDFADEITRARRQGTAAVLIDDGKSWGNFGHDLASRMDVIVSADKTVSSFESWSDDISTPILDVLRKYVKSTKKDKV